MNKLLSVFNLESNALTEIFIASHNTGSLSVNRYLYKGEKWMGSREWVGGGQDLLTVQVLPFVPYREHDMCLKQKSKTGMVEVIL